MQEFSLADYPAMPPVTLTEQTAAEYAARQTVRRKVGEIAASALLVLPAAATAIGVAEIPASIDAGPGLSADVRVQVADYSGVGYGPTTFGFPKAKIADIHGIDIGVKFTVTKFDTQAGGDEAQTLAAISANPKQILGPEIKRTFIERGLEGLVSGLAVYGGAAFALRRLRRRQKTEATTDDRQLEHLESIDSLPEAVWTALPEAMLAQNRTEITALRQKQQYRAAHPLHRKVTALVAGASVLAAGALVREADSLTPPAARRTIILSKDSPNPYIRNVVADEPILDGAFATSYLGYLGSKGVTELSSLIENVNNYWRGQADSLINTVLPDFLAQHDLSWLFNDPNWIGFADITDAHDKRPFMQYFLRPVLNAFVQSLPVRFIANEGDQGNYSGKSVLDNGVQQRVADALPLGPDGKPIEEVYVPGNHDPLDTKAARKATAKGVDGKIYHPIIPLDKTDNYTASIDGITFVGSGDLNRTTHGTLPATHEGQMANDAQQGEQLAQKVREVYTKTGRKPIVLAHEPEAGYAAITSGDAAAVFDGHWHRELPLKAYANPDGTLTLQQIQGSASGEGPNDPIALYNKATTTGYLSLWFVNKLTNEMREIVITIDPGGSLPTMAFMPQPKPDQAIAAADDSDIQAFKKYDPDLLITQPGSGVSNIAAGHH